ncbi:hypothetical protein MXD62_21375 [Frankia sp. Mgl5]|nr:aminoacyl--tRNA ligase-related protein [Frankia sp. Mgl5]MCK9929690.1 hypothetical protein [Frankia sp. Mgl5]
MIYRSRSHSYRELPLRIAELGGMYRSELSGVLGGLTRVRAIQLNDAHIFCTLDQVADEARRAVEQIGRAHQALGIAPARYRLSLPCSGGKYGRRARAVAAVHRPAERGSGPLRAELQGGRRRGRILRTEDRRPGRRRHQSGVHPVHRPGRLPPARAVRPALAVSGRQAGERRPGLRDAAG